MIPHGDIVGVITPINILFRGGWRILSPHENKDDDYDDFLVMMMMMMMIMIVIVMMMMMMMMIMIMTIVSVEQRPGWGEHVQTGSFNMLKHLRRANVLRFPRRRTLNPKTLNHPKP